jgi:hypothetical protein
MKMNHTQKNIYGLTTDIGYVAILPAITILGFIFNVTASIILANKYFKETMYKFLLANSTIDSIYLFLISFLPIARCLDMCNLSSKYLPKLYELYIFLFTTHVLSTVSSLTNVSVAYDRYFSISKINRCKWKFNLKLIIFLYFCFSIVNHIPTIMSFKLSTDLTNSSINLFHNHHHQHEYNQAHYYIKSTKFGEAIEARFLIIILQININLTPSALVILANILLLFKLRRQASLIKKKHRKAFFSLHSKQANGEIQMISFNFNGSSDSQIELENSENTFFSKKHSKIERNLTSMIVVISILYVFGRFANTISATLFLFFNLKSELIRFLILLCNLVEFTTYGMNFFVFYAFDKKFERIFNKYLIYLLESVLHCNRKK